MIPKQLSIVLLFCIVVSGDMTSSCEPRFFIRKKFIRK